MAVVYSKVLLFDPPLIYTAPDTCVFGAVYTDFGINTGPTITFITVGLLPDRLPKHWLTDNVLSGYVPGREITQEGDEHQDTPLVSPL